MKHLGLIVVIAGALLLAGTPKQNIPSVTSDSDVLTYVLADQNRILYVSTNGSNPIIGGLTRTPSTPITPAQFEQRCDFYVARFPAIVADGDSACLRAHRSEARVFVRGARFELSSSGFTVFVRAEGAR